MFCNKKNRSIVKCMPFKISRVLFLSEPEVNCHELLVTGTWMEKVNQICLWEYGLTTLDNNNRVQYKSDCMSDSVDDPRFLGSLVHRGSVQDMKVHFSSQKVFTASSDGSLQLFQLDHPHRNSDHFSLTNLMVSDRVWYPFAHNDFYKPALSSLCVSSKNDYIFIGDDLGHLAVINLDLIPIISKEITNPIALSGYDVTTVNAMEFVDDRLLLTVNQLGQLKVWDIRTGFINPERRLLRPGESQPLYCIAHHPGQSHLLSVGGVGTSNGSAAYIWDLRAEKFPLTEIACDGRIIWETAFHPRQPRHIYMATESAGLLQISDDDGSNSWTECEGSRKKLTVSSVSPQGINNSSVISFDLTHTLMACVCSDSILHTLDCDKTIC